VRTKGSVLTSTSRVQVVPTYIVGYEYSFSEKTGIVAQFYTSPSIFTHEDTDLDGLLKTKHQISVGVHHPRRGVDVVVRDHGEHRQLRQYAR